MEEKLQETLKEGEVLLWTGRPEPFHTLDKTCKPAILRRILLTAGVILALILGYAWIARSQNAGMSAGVIVILLAFGARIALDDFLTARSLRKDCLYAATDSRLILVSQSNNRDVPYDKIPVATLGRDADGHTSLLCGMEAKKNPAHWRAAAMPLRDPIDPDTGLCSDLVLYALPEPEKLKAALKGYLTIT